MAAPRPPALRLRQLRQQRRRQRLRLRRRLGGVLLIGQIALTKLYHLALTGDVQLTFRMVWDFAYVTFVQEHQDSKISL